MKFGSKKAIFGAILGGFQGFGPCLGFSHPSHPHLGEISFSSTFFFTPSLKPSGFLAANLACTKLMSALKRFANSKESSSKDWLNEVKSEGRGAPFPEFLFPPPDLAKDDSSPSFSTFASWKL